MQKELLGASSSKSISVASLLKEINLALSKHVEAPAYEAEHLLAKILSASRSELFTKLHERVPMHLRTKLHQWVEERKQGKPLPLILSRVFFMGLPLRVIPGVFIPREETETVARTVLHRHPVGNCLLDVGTGTGCLGLTLAYYGQYQHIYLSEHNTLAMKIARENATALKLSNIHFLYGDFKNISKQLKGEVDVLVSNPPYIPRHNISRLSEDVRKYEPHSALNGGNSGLRFLKSLISESPRLMKKGGLIAVEIGNQQFSSVQKLLNEAGYKSVMLVRDFRGQDRCVSARWKNL